MSRVRIEPKAFNQLKFYQLTDHRLYLEFIDSLRQLDKGVLPSGEKITDDGVLMHYHMVDLPGSNSTAGYIIWHENQKRKTADVTHIIKGSMSGN